MGFFSQNCESCGQSVKSPYELPARIAWQNQAVAITKNGSILKGAYDGYGRIDYGGGLGDDGGRYDVGGSNTVYHLLCWEKAGKPTEYLGASEDADDQGYFYDPPDAG